MCSRRVPHNKHMLVVIQKIPIGQYPIQKVPHDLTKHGSGQWPLSCHTLSIGYPTPKHAPSSTNLSTQTCSPQGKSAVGHGSGIYCDEIIMHNMQIFQPFAPGVLSQSMVSRAETSLDRYILSLSSETTQHRQLSCSSCSRVYGVKAADMYSTVQAILK